jgi:hypothetical protein
MVNCNNSYYIYIELFKTFTKFGFPLFRGQNLQHLLHCNARVGGWEFPQDSFYFLCIFLLDNITIFCMIELLVIMLIYVLYNLDSLFTILLCKIMRLLRVLLLHYKIHVSNPPHIWSVYYGNVPSSMN